MLIQQGPAVALRAAAQIFSLNMKPAGKGILRTEIRILGGFQSRYRVDHGPLERTEDAKSHLTLDHWLILSQAFSFPSHTF